VQTSEKAEIKVGDWVRDNGNNRVFKVARFGKTSYYDELGFKSVTFEKAELWIPQYGRDWVAIPTTNENMFMVVLWSKEVEATMGQSKLQYEPFTKSLPTFVKVKQ
jgi:hypothetical protein